MFTLGLTGSVGMGKTTAANYFRQQRISVFDADKVVWQLLDENSNAIEQINKSFQGVVFDGQVNREELGKLVFADNDALSRLEAILHPLVRNRQTKFLKVAAKHRKPLVVLDIPLLFETGGDLYCDATAVVSAPLYLQKIRVMNRTSMTEEKFFGILKRQMDDREKRRRADFIIPTGLGKRIGFQHVKEIIRIVTKLNSFSQRFITGNFKLKR